MSDLPMLTADDCRRSAGAAREDGNERRALAWDRLAAQKDEEIAAMTNPHTQTEGR